MIAAWERPSAGPCAKSVAGIAVLNARGYPIGPVIDGYSVQEAASVLGVAEGRVWELLARGVLLGTPEGDSMRVFLKGQAGPIATTSAREEPVRGNGNGGTHGSTAEASAFRELLTEFRNLTERYGQALLALGEARGEVAGLRSRVDLLEARLDVRMPPSYDEAPLAWEPPDAAPVAPEPRPAATPREQVQRTRKAKPAWRAAPSRKGRSNRDAVAGFAAALERAQDPNPAHLAEASEAAADEPLDVAPPAVEATVEATSEDATEAVEAASIVADVADEESPGGEEVAAEVVADVAAESVLEEIAIAAASDEEIPAGEVAAEAAPDADVASAEAPTYSAVVVEPDWFADGDFAWLDAADAEARGEAEPAEAQPEVQAEALAEAEPEPMPEAVGEPQAEPEPMSVSEDAPLTEMAPTPEPEPEPDPAAQLQAAFEPEVEFEPWQPPEPVAPSVVAEPAAEPELERAPEPPTMSTAVAVGDLGEEEVMWLGAEPEATSIVRDQPGPAPQAQVDPWPVVDTVRPPLAMTEDELARLALDEGWDDSEVAAIRAMISPPPHPAVDLPGAAELHEAMAALEAVPVRPDLSLDASRQWSKPASGGDEPPTYDDWGFETEPTLRPAPSPSASPSPAPPRDVTSALRQTASDPGWLGRRTGPAASAYRRLRRLFPG